MKRLICTVTTVVSCSLLPAQNFWQDYPYLNRGDSARSFISVEGGFNFGSDGVNNEFMMDFYRGGHLDSTFIEKSTGALLPSNRFGLSTMSGITYGIELNDSTHEILTISALRRNNLTGRFSDDAFHLAFQGNTRYKGQEADFGGTRFTGMTWSQLKFGYITPHQNGGISFSFSLLAGHQYNQLDIKYGKLFTDSQGMYVDGSIGADYWSTDTTNTESMALNGWGTSVDITWLRHWMTKNNNMAVLKFDFLDFGFINWNDKTIHRYTDTTFSYTGVDITEIFLNPNYVAELPSEDQFIKSDTAEFHRSIFLPAVIRGSYQQSFMNGRLSARCTIAMPFWSEALPFGSIIATWNSQKYKYAVSTGVAYGGYARVQVPVKVVLYMVRKTSLEIGTTNALGFISPATISGGGAYAKLSYCF